MTTNCTVCYNNNVSETRLRGTDYLCVDCDDRLSHLRQRRIDKKLISILDAEGKEECCYG